jgi:hypothetical protein
MKKLYDDSSDISYFLSKIHWPDPKSDLNCSIMSACCGEGSYVDQQVMREYFYKSPWIIAFAFIMATFLGTLSASVSISQAEAQNDYLTSSYSSSVYPVACVYLQDCQNKLGGGADE